MSNTMFGLSVLTVLMWIGFLIYKSLQEEAQALRRAVFVRDDVFPQNAQTLLQQRHPDWPVEVTKAAWAGLREFLVMQALWPDKRFGMPSFLTDEAWHTFIDSTSEYQAFCEAAFGGVLVHVPDDAAQPHAMSAKTVFSREVLNTWWASRTLRTEHSGLLPTIPGWLSSRSSPLLFLLDSQFPEQAGKRGWYYSPECFTALELQLAKVLRETARAAETGAGCASGGCGGGAC